MGLLRGSPQRDGSMGGGSLSNGMCLLGGGPPQRDGSTGGGPLNGMGLLGEQTPSMDLGVCSQPRGAPHPHFHCRTPPHPSSTIMLPWTWWALLLLYAAGRLFGCLGPPPQELRNPPEVGTSPWVPLEMTTGDERFRAEATCCKMSPQDSCHGQVGGSPLPGKLGGVLGTPHPGQPLCRAWGAPRPRGMVLRG